MLAMLGSAGNIPLHQHSNRPCQRQACKLIHCHACRLTRPVDHSLPRHCFSSAMTLCSSCLAQKLVSGLWSNSATCSMVQVNTEYKCAGRQTGQAQAQADKQRCSLPPTLLKYFSTNCSPVIHSFTTLQSVQVTSYLTCSRAVTISENNETTILTTQHASLHKMACCALKEKQDLTANAQLSSSVTAP